MEKMRIDLVAIGEILVDFISVEPAESLYFADTFRRHLGGSPANIATNVSRLGRHAAIIGKIGGGAFGQFLKRQLDENGVNTNYMVMDHSVHTSMVFVSQTGGTPDFQPSRDADYKLTNQDIPDDVVLEAKIIHTSTWPISREPGRSAIYKAFQLGTKAGKIISFDPNYSPVVWPDYQEAQEVIRDLYQYVTLTKVSQDDALRFFGEGQTPEKYIEMLHELGPKTVVFTMGQKGSIISQNGCILGHLPSRPIKVVDATGAGDAFWSGFLVAMLDGEPLNRCLLFAREVVEMKLRTIGTLPVSIDRQVIYNQLPDWEMKLPPTG